MEKPLLWMAQTKKGMQSMPEDVQDEFGYALDRVQQGETPKGASRMAGNLRDVMEIRADNRGDTYRAMYTVKFEGVVYVLDVLKKKSKKGRSTPRADLQRLQERLKPARIDYEETDDAEDE